MQAEMLVQSGSSGSITTAVNYIMSLSGFWFFNYFSFLCMNQSGHLCMIFKNQNTFCAIGFILIKDNMCCSLHLQLQHLTTSFTVRVA